MMHHIIQAIESETGRPLASRLSEAEAAASYHIGINKLPTLSEQSNRPAQITITTALKRVRQALSSQDPNRPRRPFRARKRRKNNQSENSREG
jgi:hypothetical protein